MLDYMSRQAMDLNGVDLFRLPIFDFVDIWQNLTWVYKFGAILLGFITVISVSNEYRYGTIKQNIIDGLSRKEFLLSKMSFIAVSSAIYCLLILIIGLIMGFAWSAVTDISYIIKNIEFVLAYYLVLVGFQLFSLLITLLIKRSGIVILLLLFYFILIEGILWMMLTFKYEIDWACSLLPMRGMSEIISNPFPKYFFQQVETNVLWTGALVSLSFIALYSFLSFWVFTKKDIR